MSYQSAIVTGGSGFIGSHLVDALVERGISVTVVDLVLPADDVKNAKATYKVADIRSTSMTELFLGVMPDVVFHLAAHIDDRASVLDPVLNAEHNILGTLHVLEASRKAGVKRFIFAGTGVSYGRADVIPTPESAMSKPLTPYAVSKLTCERYLKCYEAIHGLSWMSLRFANVYGPRQDGSKECGAIAIFTKRILNGETIAINNDGKTTRDYVYVQDVVRACLAAGDSIANEVINIGTAQQTSTFELLEMVESAMGKTVEHQLRSEIQDEVKQCALAIDKAQKLLDWAPSMQLKAGIAETVAWYLNRI
ncbi:MAG: NAD-dependent epimerase/dehydratase family protein [Patescibacteria group bacterium]|jgi:UDP-glucose 4-epimerase